MPPPVKPRPPAWLRERMKPFEIAMAALIIAAAISACIAALGPLREKAHAMEALILLGSARMDATLDFSMRGTLQEDGANAQPLPISQSAGMQHDPQRENRVKDMRYERLGDAVRATGQLHSGAHPVQLGMRPALPADAPAWTVLWLCGGKPVPAGWSTPYPPTISGMAPAETPASCRSAATDRTP